MIPLLYFLARIFAIFLKSKHIPEPILYTPPAFFLLKVFIADIISFVFKKSLKLFRFLKVIFFFDNFIFLIILGITNGDFCFLSVKLKILPMQTFMGCFFNKFLRCFSAISFVNPYLFCGFVWFILFFSNCLNQI